jgi:hypothetical protein
LTERGPQPGPKRLTLDEFLDREGGLAELQRRAQGDAKLSRQLDVQSRLDDSLHRLFEAPEVAVELPAGRSAASRRWVWGLAAALLLAMLGGWWVWLKPGGPRDVLGSLYRETVASGFKPGSVCTTDEEFANWCQSYLNQPIYPKGVPTGVEFLGWNVAPTFGPRTSVLLARVDSAPVLVVMSRVDRQKVTPKLDPNCSLHLFERRIGDVVLYEVTPKDQQVILPALSGEPPH